MRWEMLGVVAAVAACSRSASDEANCRALFEQRDYDAAITVCERAFARGGRAEVGLTAARAGYALGRSGDTVRLANQLLHGPKAASARHLLGRVHLANGETEQGWAELHQALALH